MAYQYEVDGFEKFIEKVSELEKEQRTIFCMFSGAKDANGKSWCPDCVKAEPVVKGCLNNVDGSAVLLYCSVGGRDYWMDKTNDFRVHPGLKLTGIPTLLKWGEPHRKLVEEQLFKPELIEIMLEE